MEPELVLGSERVTALGLDQELVLELVLESGLGSESVRGLAMALEGGKRFVRVDPFESRQK